MLTSVLLAFRDRGAGSYQNRNRDDGFREDRHRSHFRGRKFSSPVH
jgi:hypothetical protein